MKKVFITGDAGMLGNAITEILKTDSNYKVMQFPELETYSNQFHYFKGKQVKKLEVDITNTESLDKVFEHLDEDSIVINCAAYVNTDKCEKFSYEAVMSNVIGTQNIIERCKRVNCPIIHFSTTAVFDPEYYMEHFDGKFDETTIANPKTIYGATKYASELAVKQSIWKHVIIKPVFIYGNFPYDNSSNLNKILKSIVFNESEKIDITLSYEFKKNYMHSDYFALMMKQIIDNIEDCYNQDFIISRDPKFGKTFDLWLHDLADIACVQFPEVCDKINLKPEDDYLKNHLGVSNNFYKKFKSFKLPNNNQDDIENLRTVYKSIAKYATYINRRTE